jgi:archaellum component FlaC
MKGFNPETGKGDNKNLISRLERISRNCEEILYTITIVTQINGSKRPSFKDKEVNRLKNKVKNKVNAISAAATGFLRELKSSKIDINQRISLEADISTLTAEVMTLQSLLETQEVNIDAIKEQVESIINIVNKIKNNLRRSR